MCVCGPFARWYFARLRVRACAHVPRSAADVNVVLDQAKLMKLPERVATIVIGNPLIADASVQTGGMMVITGKGYGTTNIIALDRAGSVLMEKIRRGEGAAGPVVVVYSGDGSRDPIAARLLRTADHARRRQCVFAAMLAQTAAATPRPRAAPRQPPSD